MSTETTLKVITAKKHMGQDTMLVVGFLKGDDIFVDLRPVNRFTTKYPQGPCFLEGDIIDLPDGDAVVQMIEAIPTVDLAALPGIKKAIHDSRCIALTKRVWGYQYLFKKLSVE